MADDDIAIVGVGCRFPGADNLQEFWQVLVNGENHVVDIPLERWNSDFHFSEDKDAQGKTYVNRAGLLKNYDEWDNKFFGVGDAEAAKVDPQQRYVLECTHMALEDGGITRSQISGSQTGVYIGVMNNDYKSLMSIDTPGEGMDSYSATGLSATVIASRVSFVFDLHGPCMVVDTACSSALYAIHLGCQAIKTGDCTRAICGGVSSILNPESLITLCKARMLSPTGQCQTFCDTADGYARGEGCGIVVLMKMKEAMQQNAKIWGIIKTGSNQDGAAAHPITAPSGDQQYALLEQVYKTNNIDPASVQYIEAHGTGTALGDPTEANALGKFFSLYRKGKTEVPLMIGSVKSNIGHTESAAGVAGLIKVLLMMQHGKFVPSLHVNKDKSNVNKKILLKEYSLDIVVDVLEWRNNVRGERIACINSFGFGGSNCHAVVVQPRRSTLDEKIITDIQTTPFPAFVCISAPSEEALVHNLDGFQNDIDYMTSLDLNKLSFTSLHHRNIMRYRTLLYGKCTSDLKSQIQPRKKQAASMNPTQKNNLIFLYCGVGTTWRGMCKEMMGLDIFKETVREIDGYLKSLTSWRVEDMFNSDESSYDDPLVNHVCIFATQVALTRVWKSLNIVPDVILGQSVGEVVAAYSSGIIPLSEAVRVIYYRSKILAENSGGSMMVIGNMPVSEIENLCAQYISVTIAVYSSPVACTLSGDPKELKQIQEKLQNTNGKQAYLIRHLDVQTAYHSPYVERCKKDIENSIGAVQHVKQSKFAILSTVTGQKACQNDFTSGHYWAENVRKPVLLYQAVQKAIVNGTRTVVLELGPRQVLKAHMENILLGQSGICLPSMNAGKEFSCLFESLTNLYQIGYDINVDFLKLRSCLPMEFPKYCFLKSKQLFLPETSKCYLAGMAMQDDQTHQYVRRSTTATEKGFEICIDPESTPFVFDHSMSGTVLVPGATYIDVAFHVASTCLNKQISSLSVSAEFLHTMIPSLNSKTVLNIDVSQHNDDFIHLICYKEHVNFAVAEVKVKNEFHINKVNLNDILERCTTKYDQLTCYHRLQQYGFVFGPSLQLIQYSFSNQQECLASVSVPENVMLEFTKTKFHPSVIDSVFQTVALTEQSNSTMNAMPKGVKGVQISSTLQKDMFIYTCVTKSSQSEKHFYSAVMSKDGFILAEIQDHCIKILGNSEQSAGLKYHVTSASYRPSQLTHLDPGSVYVLSSVNFDGVTSEVANFIKSHSVFRTVSSPEQIDDKNVKAVLIYNNTVCKGNDAMLETVLRGYENTRSLFLAMSQKNIRCPIFVTTENTQVSSENGDRCRNIMDSVYWGMVRCVRLEGFFDDIRLIDIDATNFSQMALLKVLASSDPKNAEFTLKGSQAYHLTISQANESELTRDIIMDLDQSAVLQSNIVETRKELWFKPCELPSGTKQRRTEPVRLSSVVRFDAFLESEIKKEFSSILGKNTESMDVIAVEGTGWNSSNDEVVFYFPVRVITPFVQVPKKCVILKRKIPYYKAGMFNMLAILYKFSLSVQEKASVIIIENEETETKGSHMLKELLRQKNCDAQISSLRTLKHSLLPGKIDSLVIFAELNSDMIEVLLKRFPSARQIVTLQICMSNNLRSKVQFACPEMHLHVLHMSDMFKPATVSETASDIFRLAYLANIHRQYVLERVLFWTYPMDSVDINNQQDRKRIGLRTDKRGIFRTNSCYIVVGGMTGLGWILLQNMAELGAGHIAIFSRSALTEEKEKEIRTVEKQFSCRIYSIQANVTDLKSVEVGFLTLSSQIGQIPIRGIFQGAGVLYDGLLQSQTKETVEKVIAPKLQGSWNLHILSKNLHLDFFVMHSSVASVIGNVGQSNYAAGNSFMDSLAELRRSEGLCGQSLNWGPVTVGMSKGSEKQLEGGGFSLLSEDEAKRCFVDALIDNSVQCIFVKVNWNKIVDLTQQKVKYKLLLAKQTYSDGPSFTCNVLWNNVDTGEREEKLREMVRKIICQEFPITDRELCNETPLISLGFDSMAAQSFAGNFFTLSGIKIPIVKLLSSEISVNSLVQFCLENLPDISETTEIGVDSARTAVKALSCQIPYMQLNVLQKYSKNRNSQQNVDIYEVELFGLTGIPFKEWREIIKEVLMLYPQLRTRYFFLENEIRIVEDGQVSDSVPELTKIPYPDELKKEDEVLFVFNVEQEHPVKFQIAFCKAKTFLRIILHKVVSDMNCLSYICKAIGKIGLALKEGTSLPKTHKVDVAKVLRSVLVPTWQKAEMFWEKEMKREIKPVTLGSKLIATSSLPMSDYCVAKEHISENDYKLIEMYLANHGITMFNLSASLFQLLLYIETSERSIFINTVVDIRGRVPELREQVLRCLNVIPVVADFRDSITLDTFLDENRAKLQRTMEFGFYPEDLILKNITSGDVREKLCRHYLIMDNIQVMNNIMSEKWKIKLKRILHRRADYETKFLTTYDTKRRQLSFELGWSTSICGTNTGIRMMKKLVWILKNLQSLGSVKIIHLNQMFESNQATQNTTPYLLAVKPKEYASQLAENEIAENLSTILEGTFRKETSQGWSHDVRLVLESSKDNSVLIMAAGKRRINMLHLKYCYLQRQHGLYCLVVSDTERQYVFKTKDETQAITWTNTIREVLSSLKSNGYEIQTQL